MENIRVSIQGLDEHIWFRKVIEHHIKSRTELDMDFIRWLKKIIKLDIENYGKKVKDSYMMSSYAAYAKIQMSRLRYHWDCVHFIMASHKLA